VPKGEWTISYRKHDQGGRIVLHYPTKVLAQEDIVPISKEYYRATLRGPNDFMQVYRNGIETLR